MRSCASDDCNFLHGLRSVSRSDADCCVGTQRVPLVLVIDLIESTILPTCFFGGAADRAC